MSTLSVMSATSHRPRLWNSSMYSLTRCGLYLSLHLVAVAESSVLLVVPLLLEPAPAGPSAESACSVRLVVLLQGTLESCNVGVDGMNVNPDLVGHGLSDSARQPLHPRVPFPRIDVVDGQIAYALVAKLHELLGRFEIHAAHDRETLPWLSCIGEA
ncbi:hypothetical protein K456DRAFT_50182 [Colletotrichum gloeosporioides 23]|nr:hypothetical protein K456DRAFT_50182 [Colletotrichum gloeosporioides 23]